MVINKWYLFCSVLEWLECSNFECHQMLIKMFRILMVFGKKTAILPTIQKLKAIHNRNAIQPFEYPTHFLSPHCICYPHKTYLTNGSSILKVCERLLKQKDLNTDIYLIIRQIHSKFDCVLYLDESGFRVPGTQFPHCIVFRLFLPLSVCFL